MSLPIGSAAAAVVRTPRPFSPGTAPERMEAR